MGCLLQLIQFFLYFIQKMHFAGSLELNIFLLVELHCKRFRFLDIQRGPSLFTVRNLTHYFVLIV